MHQYKMFTRAMLSVCVLSFALAACDRSESPAKTDADVTKAQVEGDKKIARERHDAAEKTMNAQKDVNKASDELAHESAEGHRAVTVAEAETNHKMSIEKCEALTGEPRTDCKKQADLAFDQAKLQADTVEHATDPKR